MVGYIFSYQQRLFLALHLRPLLLSEAQPRAQAARFDTGAPVAAKIPNGRGNTFLYFAYGSNMLTRRLCAAARTPSATAIGIGYVVGRRLTFDKASNDGSGKCDAEATGSANDRTYGVLFEINKSEKLNLNRSEGINKGYREEIVTVVTLEGDREALTYIATAKDATLRPYHWYRAFVIFGAVEHGLPAPYIEWLRTFNCKLDLNAERRAENESILFGS